MSGWTLTDAGRARLQARPLDDSDIVAVACVRNEELRLPYFLDYHKRLGVNRIFVVDNASNDSTPAILDADPDVVRILAPGSYAESACGVDWTNAVTLEFAPNHWVLTLDADEFFFFPGCEQLPLSTLTGYLERKGATAFRAPMLDMYPSGPLAQANYAPGEDILRACPLFDPEGYDWVKREGLEFMQRGGPRRRLFWEGWEREHKAPVVMKIPLIRWRGTAPYTMSTHLVEYERFAKVSGLTLHFKFVQDFGPRAEEESRRGEHFADARQYQAYAEGLRQSPQLAVETKHSQRFRCSAQLVEMGFMHAPDDFDLAPGLEVG